jgi:hypothetical protein
MRYLILLVLLLSGCSKPPEPKRKDFDRQTVRIHFMPFENRGQMLKYFAKEGLTQKKQEKGLARWHVDSEGSPIGACTVHFVKGAYSVLAHEVNHCRWGDYHD